MLNYPFFFWSYITLIAFFKLTMGSARERFYFISKCFAQNDLGGGLGHMSNIPLVFPTEQIGKVCYIDGIQMQSSGSVNSMHK